MRDANHLRENLEFQLSLFRLMTIPHQPGEQTKMKELDGEAQLERLFQLTDPGYGD